MRPRLRTTLPLIGCCVLAACGNDADRSAGGNDMLQPPGSGSSSSTLVVNPKVAESGGSLTAAVENAGADTLLYDPGYGLERHTDTGWQPVPLPPVAAPAVILTAPPETRGESFQVTIPKSLEPGLYRVTNRVRPRGERTGDRQLTVEFRIR